MSAEEPTIFPGGRGTITTNTGGENPAWHQPVSFPDWRAVLDLEPLEEATRARYAKSIIAYLGYLKKLHERATVAGAKKFLEEHAAPGPSGATERAALRWFFVAHRRRHGRSRESAAMPDISPPTPMPIPPDTPAWEADLIRTLRLRGLLWNTEQIYRGWIRRFATSISPKSPSEAGATEVRDFLSALAVRDQVAASTQRQALNALIFYFREVRRHDLGDLGDFRRSARRPHVPVVLSPAEVRRLFEHLEGTWRLMADQWIGNPELQARDGEAAARTEPRPPTDLFAGGRRSRDAGFGWA